MADGSKPTGEKKLPEEKLAARVPPAIKLVEPDPYHLVVVGERRTRVVICRTPDELAGSLQEFRGNPEVTDLLLFQGRRLEAAVIHITNVVFKDGEMEAGRSEVTREEERIEAS